MSNNILGNILGNVIETSRDFYLNADFDGTLRGLPSRLDENGPTWVHQMSQHFLFAPGERDALILHAPLPGDFTAYLAGKGLRLPPVLIHPAFNPEALFTPFGWNPHAAALNRRYARPALHPDLEAVRIANSRVFSHAFEREAASALEGTGPESGVAGGFFPGRLFESLENLESHIRDHPSASGWVAKGNHGHAGTANRRLPDATLGRMERHELEILFRENPPVALEPWHERVQDMAVNFQVDREGRVAGLRGHELMNSRDGAFLGVKVSPTGQPPEPWRASLERAAVRLGPALQALGYSGPVSLDAYSWRSPEGVALRTYVDINARLSMALPAHGLAQRLPGRHILWTWAKPRKLALPGTYAGIMERLGAADFNPDTRVGILAVSPIHLDLGPGTPAMPKRVSFAFSARDEEELDHLRAAFGKALGRPRF